MNLNKMEVMLIREPKGLRGVILPVGGRLSDEFRVALGPLCTDGEQIGAIVNSTVYQLHLVWKLIPSFNSAYLTITSRLNYFHVFYLGMPLKTIWKLQYVQNAPEPVF